MTLITTPELFASKEDRCDTCTPGFYSQCMLPMGHAGLCVMGALDDEWLKEDEETI